jgi:hypothetical protein
MNWILADNYSSFGWHTHMQSLKIIIAYSARRCAHTFEELSMKLLTSSFDAIDIHAMQHKVTTGIADMISQAHLENIVSARLQVRHQGSPLCPWKGAGWSFKVPQLRYLVMP